MLCRFEFTTFLLGRLSPEFVAVLSFSGGATNVRCMEGADSTESLQGRADFFFCTKLQNYLFANKTPFLLQILWVRPVVYLPALISQGEIPLCLCFADNHLISFHSIHIFISIHCFRHFAHHHNVWSYFYYLLHENKILAIFFIVEAHAAMDLNPTLWQIIQI